MSKASGARRNGRQPPQRKPARMTEAREGSEESSTEIKFLPPLKPHARLFVVLGIVLLVWAGGLLALYWKTVYPNRDKPHAVEVDRPSGTEGR